TLRAQQPQIHSNPIKDDALSTQCVTVLKCETWLRTLWWSATQRANATHGAGCASRCEDATASEIRHGRGAVSVDWVRVPGEFSHRMTNDASRLGQGGLPFARGEQ